MERRRMERRRMTREWRWRMARERERGMTTQHSLERKMEEPSGKRRGRGRQP